jgi:ABC-2 type transport system ATP-binding protein
MIVVERLYKSYGRILAVEDVNFEITKGEIVGFLGPNGAGKTTTLRILTSYLPATSGVAKVAGHDVRNESLQVRQNIGYLPESVPLYPEMRVEEYLQYRAKLKGVGREARKSRIDYCIERCRIKEVRRRLIGTLSKGYRQRVGLADAMIHDPRILILDEPTVGLDPIQIRETLALIKELGEQRTILLSTHILSEVEAICRRVIIISAGRVTLDKTMEALDEMRSIAVEVHGPAEQVADTLRSTEGVGEVEARGESNGVARFEVRTADRRDLREAISRRLMERGWAIRELSMRRRTLEEHFFDAVKQRTEERLAAARPRWAAPDHALESAAKDSQP